MRIFKVTLVIKDKVINATVKSINMVQLVAQCDRSNIKCTVQLIKGD